MKRRDSQKCWKAILGNTIQENIRWMNIMPSDMIRRALIQKSSVRPDMIQEAMKQDMRPEKAMKQLNLISMSLRRNMST